MKRCNTDVIDDLVVFLNADTTRLSTVTHLYLANSKVADKLDTPDVFNRFFNKLKQCCQMINLNLENNNLVKLSIKPIVFGCIIKCMPKLQTINLRDNNIHIGDLLSIESTVIDIIPDIKVIASGCKSCPKDLVLPYSKWKLNRQFCELELHEMLDVAEYKFKTNPLSKKLFGYRYNNTNKKNISSNEQYLPTNMPYSALNIDGYIFLLAKFSDVPKNILEYNKPSNPRNHNSISKMKRVSIIISRTSNDISELKFRLVKTQATKGNLEKLINKNRTEAINLHKVNLMGLYQYRKYKTSTANFIGKVYLISEYVNGEEGFEVMCRNIPMDTFLFNFDTPMILNHQIKPDKIILSISYLLSLMKLHARGLIHTDIKPENSIINNKRVEFVDFETSLPYGAKTAINHNNLLGTPGYKAPELSLVGNNNYNFNNDYYSCGLILRQILYPVFCAVTLESRREIIFVSNPDERAFSRLGLHPESYLARHFATGLSANYAEEACQAVLGLTAQNPKERSNITKAFFTFALLYPDYAHDIFNLELNIVLDKIKCTLSRYPKAEVNLKAAVCGADEILARRYDFNNKTIYNAALNHLYRLLHLEYFLSVYELCNGEPPFSTSEIFIHSVREIFNNQDLDLSKHEGIYYYNQAMEKRIDYHHWFKHFMSGAFAKLAQEILDTQPIIANSNIIDELKHRQVETLEWLGAGRPYADVLQYFKSSVNNLLQTADHNPTLVSLLHTYFDSSLNKAEIIMQQHSPKSPRLQLI